MGLPNSRHNNHWFRNWNLRHEQYTLNNHNWTTLCQVPVKFSWRREYDSYIEQLDQGNLTMTRTFGTSAVNVNIGLYALGNGKTAHVVTNNKTSLIIELKNSEYVILGTSDIEAFTESFSQNVYQIKSP
jgi:hypothetical protein